MAIVINLRLGSWNKRLWYEEPNDCDSEKKFDSIWKEIKEMDSSMEWEDFLKKVKSLFQQNGFERIAK